MGSYPEASAIWLVKCASLASDMTPRSPRSASTRQQFYHGATTPDLTYPSQTNSLVICDLTFERNIHDSAGMCRRQVSCVPCDVAGAPGIYPERWSAWHSGS